MERGLLLVREGHGDGLTVHAIGAPRAWSDRVSLPLPRAFGLRHASCLPAAITEPPSRPLPVTSASLPGSMSPPPWARQSYAWRSAESRDTEEDGVPIVADSAV